MPAMAQDINNDVAAADTIPADTIAALSPEDAALIAVSDSISADTTKTLTVQERIERLLTADLFRKSQLGLMVYDLTADTVIYAYNEQQTLRPASTNKLVTAITALDYLGESYRYATQLRCSPQKNGTAILTLRGGMDPRISTDDINAFIEAIKLNARDTIYGELRADRSFKDNDMLGEGWCWDDKNPVLTPMLWNRKDQLLTRLQDAIRAAHISLLPRDSIPRDSLGNIMLTINDEPITPKQFAITRYHTLDQILVKMMKDSDNLYAESLFYQIASKAAGNRTATAKHATNVIKQLIKKIGLRPDDYRFADGSGLSLYNYHSAEMQTMLLRYAYRNSEIYGHLYPALPIAGVDGTLKDRMKRTKAYKNVHAKTGTLTGISSLSGYLTAQNGNTIAFAIINQGIRRTAPAKAFQDKVCTILCDY